MLKPRILVAAALALGISVTNVFAAGDEINIDRNDWSFGGIGGQYDKAQLQRGFQVYREVCASCHSINRIAFRNLVQPGGPEFPEAAVKALAKEYEVTQPPNDDGEVAKGPAKLADRFPPLYANEKEARSIHNGALPPDLSIIAKARGTSFVGPWYLHPFAMMKDIATGYQEGGADYLVALLTGYKEKAPAYVRDDSGHLKPAPDPADENVLHCAAIQKGEDGKDRCVEMSEGMNYNAAFPGHQIAMLNPFAAHTNDSPQVNYTDGTKPTLEQYARDVAAFLSWASDPTLNQRKQMGWLVIVYLLITAILLYIAKRRIWATIPH